MDSPFFGWELLYAIIEDKIRCPSDIVVAFVHWQMIKFSFSCLGNGDEVQMQYLMDSFLMMLPNYHMSCVPLSLFSSRDPFRKRTLAMSVCPRTGTASPTITHYGTCWAPRSTS